MVDPELTRLRAEIAEIDREVLDALNRRLALVRRVAAHKSETGAPAIDARREAELLADLAAGNAGPLSEEGLRTAFSALLDVMKQELRAGRAVAQHAAPAAAPGPAVTSLAIVGTGLLGTSVALAARRAGVTRVVGRDEDAARLRESGIEPAASLDGIELVVVAVPVGVLAETVRAVLAEAGPETTVTDVGSTKRDVAAVADPRFVPGHPLAGGATGGPARATADLFDAATWIVSPTETSGTEHIARVEAFVSSLRAQPARLDAATHDRVLALTSHLPHAVANLLVGDVASGGEEALRYAGAALREMTRVAGANASVWTDIFLANADVLAEALAAHADASSQIVELLRTGDRPALERWVEQAAATRERLLEHAYRTEAKQLHRVRVRVPDKPGVLARITQTLGAAGINIEDFELRHVSPEYGGVLVVLVAGAENAEQARALLRREGYSAV